MLGGFTHVRVGLFVATSERRSALAVVCVPTPDTGKSVSADGSLSIVHFKDAAFDFTDLTLRAALVAHLDAGAAVRDGLLSPWLSLFEWPADDDLAPGELFASAWNRIAEANAIGRRGTDAGRPWWPFRTSAR